MDDISPPELTSFFLYLGNLGRALFAIVSAYGRSERAAEDHVSFQLKELGYSRTPHKHRITGGLYQQGLRETGC